MDYEKVSDTEVKIIKQVEEVKTVDELKARRSALESGVATLQAEIAVVDEQLAGATDLGVKTSAEVAAAAAEPIE